MKLLHLLPLVLLILGAASVRADDSALRAPLLGTWTGSVTDGEGATRNHPRATIRELTISADKITALDGDGRSLGEGSYKLVIENGVLSIDATGTAGPPSGQTMLGILKLEGGTLKWCSANGGKPRPTAFRTRPGSSYLVVLTRKK